MSGIEHSDCRPGSDAPAMSVNGAKLNIRKALVNEVVRAFTYQVRTKSQWPSLLFGNPVAPAGAAKLASHALVPFVAWAYAQQGNYILANRSIILLASWLRTFNPAEVKYAKQLLEKYYGPVCTGEDRADCG